MKTTSLAFLTGIAAILTGLARAEVISQLQLLPGDLAIGPAYYDQQSPAMARGGNISLAVWADQRAIGSGSDIYAARLDANGNLIDAVPFVVSHAAADQTMPRVVWNGSNWLVLWMSQEPTDFYWAPQVMAARVSPLGAVLDPIPIHVTPYQNSSSVLFSAASDGTNWLVVAEGGSVGEAAVLGFRISPTGTVLDPSGIIILPETYYMRYGLEVGFAGGEYLFLWTEWTFYGEDDVFAFRLTPSIQKIDATPITVAASSDYDVNPRVADDGNNFFVTYERYNTCCGQGGRVFGTRVTHAGVVRDLAGLDISGDVGITVGRKPCVAWDGANWYVAWFIPSISVARVSPAGAVLNFGGLPIDAAFAATKEEPAIAAAPGGGARVVWTDYRAASLNPKDIFSAAVPSVGQPGPGVCISVGAPSQLTPGVASSANGFLAVFVSAVSSGQRVMAQRLDAAGAPLDAQPFQIAALGPNVRNPSVACNGSLYFVVWEDRGANVIYGKRVQFDGTVLDASPISIMPGNTPDVAAIGDVFLVVDSHAPANSQYRFIYSRRVRGSDAALLDAAPVAIGGSFALIPRVAAVNGHWLAVWEGHPTHDDTTANIYGAFVETNGVAGSQLAVTLDGYYVRFHNRPAIAAGADNALVLWTDPRFGNSDWGIFARRVLPDGTILDADGPPPAPRPPLTMPTTYPGFAVTTALNNQDSPAAAWDGAQYVTAWEDQRNNTFFLDQGTDVFGARVSAAGALLDPDGFVLVDTAVPETTPALAALMGRTVSAISCFQEQAPYAAYRIGVRTLSNPSVAPPILQVTRDATGLVLSWPTNAVGFSLQTTPITGGTPVWGPAAQIPTPVGNNYVVTIPPTGSGALYRLARP